MIKLVAFFAAYRLLRRLVMILIVATLAMLLLGGSRDRARQGHVVRQFNHAAHALEELLQHTLQKGIGQ